MPSPGQTFGGVPFSEMWPAQLAAMEKWKKDHPGEDEGGFWSDLGNYAWDGLTAGAPRRLVGEVVDGNWSAAGMQAANMGGTPLGDKLLGGHPEGAPTTPHHDTSGNYTGPQSIGNIRGAVLGGYGLGDTGGNGMGSDYSQAVGQAANDIRASGRRAEQAYNQSRNTQLGYYAPAQSAYQQLYGGSVYQPPAQNQTPYGKPQQAPYTPPKPMPSQQGLGGGSSFGGGALYGPTGGPQGLGGSSNMSMYAREMPGGSSNPQGGSALLGSAGQPSQTGMPRKSSVGTAGGAIQGMTGPSPGFTGERPGAPGVYQAPFTGGGQQGGSYGPPAQQNYGPAGTEGMPTQQRDYQAGAQQRMSGPTNAQAYYNAYAPSTYMQDYTQNRQQSGYGPNVVADRYSQRQGTAGEQSNAQGLLGGMTPWATSGQNQSTGRMAARGQLGATSTSGMLGELGGMAPSARNDSLSRQVNGMPVGVNSAAAQNRILGGATAGGQMQSRMNAGGGDSGQFLAGFDPTKTMGLGSTYSKLAAEAPTYEEDFYTSQMAGDNPAHLRALERVKKEARGAAAARGGFVSGKAIDNEQRAVTGLEDAEFARLGDLAGQAGTARRARLGQELQGATSLDNNYLGRQQLQAQTGLGREGILSDLARSGDDQYGALAMNRDDNELKRTGILSDLSRAGDENALSLGRLRTDAAGQEDTLQAGRQAALDSLAGQADSTDLARRSLLTTTASSADNTKTARDRDLDLLAGTTDAANMRRQENLDALAGQSADEQYRGQQLGGTLASSADSSNMAQEAALQRAAAGASTEQRQAAKDKFDAAMQLGDAQSKIQAAMDAAAIGAVTSADIAALEASLAAAGVSAADRKAATDRIWNTVGSGVGAILSNRSSGSTPKYGESGYVPMEKL